MNKREVNTMIWHDPKFRAMTQKDQLQTLEQITTEEYPTCYFSQFVRRADRRPDIKTKKWRNIRSEMLSNSNLVCHYCGHDCSGSPSIDHLHPVSKGGDIFDKSNLVICCISCNSKKRDKVI